MAIRKSTRSEAGPSARSAGSRPSTPARFRPRADVPLYPACPQGIDWRGRLTPPVLRLRAIYGTAVAAELALREQAAEQDAEIADCLRVGVCDPLADQIGDLEDIIRPSRRPFP